MMLGPVNVIVVLIIAVVYFAVKSYTRRPRVEQGTGGEVNLPSTKITKNVEHITSVQPGRGSRDVAPCAKITEKRVDPPKANPEGDRKVAAPPIKITEKVQPQVTPVLKNQDNAPLMLTGTAPIQAKRVPLVSTQPAAPVIDGPTLQEYQNHSHASSGETTQEEQKHGRDIFYETLQKQQNDGQASSNESLKKKQNDGQASSSKTLKKKQSDGQASSNESLKEKQNDGQASSNETTQEQQNDVKTEADSIDGSKELQKKAETVKETYEYKFMQIVLKKLAEIASVERRAKAKREVLEIISKHIIEEELEEVNI